MTTTPTTLPSGTYVFKYDPGTSAGDIQVAVTAKDDFAIIDTSKDGFGVNSGSVRVGDAQYADLANFVGGFVNGAAGAAQTAEGGSAGVDLAIAGTDLFTKEANVSWAQDRLGEGVRGGEFKLYVDQADPAARDALIFGSVKGVVASEGTPLEEAVANALALVVEVKKQ